MNIYEVQNSSKNQSCPFQVPLPCHIREARALPYRTVEAHVEYGRTPSEQRRACPTSARPLNPTTTTKRTVILLETLKTPSLTVPSFLRPLGWDAPDGRSPGMDRVIHQHSALRSGWVELEFESSSASPITLAAENLTSCWAAGQHGGKSKFKSTTNRPN